MIPVLLTVLFFLFPGIVFFRENTRQKISVPEIVMYSVGISMGFWIVGFWALRMIPVSLSVFVYLSLAASLGIGAYRIAGKRHAGTPLLPIQKNVWIVLVLVLLAAPHIAIFRQQIAPSGQDMSMHTYIARVIIEKDGFPETMMPTVPVPAFGLYPFGFSTLIAMLTTLNSLPIATNALLVSVMAHFLFDASLFLLLSARFSHPVSAIATWLTAWLTNNPHLYIGWGANPTALSLALLLVACAAMLRFTGRWSIFTTWTLTFASFLTNYMLPVAALYIGVVWAGSRFRLVQSVLRTRINWATALSCTLITLPFIALFVRSGWSMSLATERFVRAFHTEELARWTGWPDMTFVQSVSALFIEAFQPILLTLYGIYLVRMVRRNARAVWSHLIFLGVMLFLLVNSRYWWVPASSVLYPYRIILLFVIPLSFVVAESVNIAITMIRRTGFIRAAPFIWSTVLILLISALLPHLKIRAYTRYALENAVVRSGDMDAFAWLSTRAGPHDVILNSDNDAGLWIPAIIGKNVTRYHTNPVDLENMSAAVTPQPVYAYIGTGGKTDIETLISESPYDVSYVLMYENSDGAKIYRLLPNR